ncbi:MAG: hypothetical protein WAN46_05770 [Gammaproteobacteria bacterium]|jgi:hypothetical protein
MHRPKGIWTLLLCLFLEIARGQALANESSASFGRTGILDRIDVNSRQVVINDLLYYLTDRVVVHTVNQQYVTLAHLRVGDVVGFRVIEADDSRKLIPEIWMLPNTDKAAPH